MNGIQTVKAWIGAPHELGSGAHCACNRCVGPGRPRKHVGVRKCGRSPSQPDCVAWKWRFGGTHRGWHHYLVVGKGDIRIG